MTWTELLDTALAGTERAGAPRKAPFSFQAEPVVGTDPDAAALGLLRAAAGVSRARRAGFLPPSADAATLPVGDPVIDPAPQVGRAAAHRLTELLSGPGQRDLLLEWCSVAAEQGRRAPHAQLPALLDSATRDAVLRPAVLRIMGSRGGWLAGLGPAWGWAQGNTSAVEWDVAPAGVRREALLLLRSRDPDAGRDLLASTWETERVQERANFLDELLVGLGPADEPFLEAALDDRGGAVREAAARLLTQLEGSAYQARASARLVAVLSVERRRLRTDELTVRLPDPESLDESGRRDGLGTPPPRGMGPAAWLLDRIVASAPLTTWTGKLGLKPTEAVELARRHDHGPAILDGLRARAALEHDARWIDALVKDLTNILHVRQLVDALPEADRIRRATNDPEPGLLRSLERPWPESLTAVVRDYLVRAMPRATDPPVVAQVRSVADLLAERGSPGIAFPALEPAPGLGQSYDRLLAMLAIRTAIRDELTRPEEDQ